MASGDPPRLSITSDVPLAPMTTLGVGGRARHFVEVGSSEAVLEALAWADARRMPVMVLGGGSNVLVADRGFDGLVLRLRICDLVERDAGSAARLLDVGAGHDWDALVARAVSSGLAGLECMSAIPGRVGATPIQNVGAYGQEVSETIDSVEVIDREARSIAMMTRDECRFAYRDSIFKREARGRYVVTRVTFSLRPGGPLSIAYPELARAVEAHCGGSKASLADVRETVIALRRRKSMVLDESDPNGHSAGSFFTNPIVDRALAERVGHLAAERGLITDGESRVPMFDAPGDRVKLSAGWLIERSGFAKGYARGRAGISTKHALALVNRGGATASEIAELASHVRAGVHEAFGVLLSPEPEWVGFMEAELARYLGDRR